MCVATPSPQQSRADSIADGPLPSDPAAETLLRDEIARAGAPPPRGQVAPLSPTATAVSERRYSIAPNEVGLTGFRLDFPEGDEATITLTLDIPPSQEFGDRSSPIGLDGCYPVSPSSRFGLPLAAQGYRQDERTCWLTYNEVANNNVYDIVFGFVSEQASLRLTERTGLLAVFLTATRDGS